jgi:non-ribosomal peptide synthetase component F
VRWDEEHHAAYIITTSGSAGEPKPVFVRSASVLPNIRDISSEFCPTRTDQIFAASPLTFDPAILDFFLALTSGANLLLLPRRLKQRPDLLFAALFSTNRVSVLQCTPGLLARIFVGDWQLPASLKIVAVGGERCTADAGTILQRLIASNVRVYHLYGLTEMSVWQSMIRICEPADASCPPIYVRGGNLLSETEFSCDEGSEVVVSSRSRHCCQSLECICRPPYTINTGDLAVWKAGSKLYWQVGVFLSLLYWI